MSLAKIEGGEVVIRIPAKVLTAAFDVLMARELVADRTIHRVEDLAAFMKEFVNCLNQEDEIGDTVLHRAFDKAIMLAVENGCEGVES